MHDLEERALRKRVVLPGHFSHPVTIEAVRPSMTPLSWHRSAGRMEA